MLRSPQQQTPGAEGGGTPARAQARHPLDRPLPQRATGSALALLFSELVQRARDVAATGDEMEARLADAGEGVGERALEIGAQALPAGLRRGGAAGSARRGFAQARARAASSLSPSSPARGC